MVSQLFSPTEPKNVSDAVVIAFLGLHIGALFVLPTTISIPLFALVYICWRISYNAGIGFLLWHQSNGKALVAWARRTGIFNDPAKGRNEFAQYYPLLKREMETKIPKDYRFDEAPLEYNTWLLFRRVVDLILMCDFTSYCCFAAACGGTPAGEWSIMTLLRWGAGIGLVLFNLWVKLDAHRVVKDFAWYWGDFFFLIDQELTFDGVFEMAPHPMYSVGYAGYYGISLMAASYRVLFISIFAHAAQFAFLAFVENPHIEKTYNPPPARTKLPDTTANGDSSVSSPTAPEFGSIEQQASADGTYSQQSSHIRNLIGLENFDLHRVVDVSAVLLQFYVYTMAFLTPSTPLYQAFFVINAIFWRLWYSVGIGYILDRQSKKKAWTRHWIKWGESNEEAWRQWKGVYHLSMTMCYVSFVTAAIKMYHLPPDWTYGMTTLRHVLGAALILLQVWTFFSIYESLGEFGWFFGDFFFERGPKLTYSGIYRYLNNPERVIGLAGVWGFALITWSMSIFFLAALSHGLTLCFIQFVERPHMEMRYGREHIRHDSGISKTIKHTLPGPLLKWHASLDKYIDDCADGVDEMLESLKPRMGAVFDNFINDANSLLRQYTGRVNITRLAPDFASLRADDYKLEVEGVVSGAPMDRTSGREGEQARTPGFRGAEHQPVVFEYGAPVRVRWTAPVQHSKHDWVGLYMVGDNDSRLVTRVSSQGRWVAVCKGAYDAGRAEAGILATERPAIEWKGETGRPGVCGELLFAGDKLWWTVGVFEFRYHHAGAHNVLAVSRPFAVRLARMSDDAATLSLPDARAAVEAALLPVVRNCFDRDPAIAPESADGAFGGVIERDGKFARRVVYALRLMFGIEFAPSVVKADGNVRNLAWRVCNAKRVLVSLASVFICDVVADGL